MKRHIIYSTAGSHSPARTDKKYIRTRGQELLLANLRLRAVYHVGSQLAVSCKLHVARRCASTLGKSVLGSGSEYDTHSQTHTRTHTDTHTDTQ